MVTQQQYLKLLGIELWERRSCKQEEKLNNMDLATDSAKKAPIDNAACATLSSLKQCVEGCQACPLAQTRTKVVFGNGNEHAKIMFIGEAPGANEDLTGEPFVGKAGMLLTEILRALHLERQDVYIANILKCRPPNNRDPVAGEVAACSPYLQQQINLINPKIIVAVGRVAAQFLLQNELSMNRLRGQIFHYGDHSIPLVVTYHPAYLLRSPGEKRRVYQDCLLLKHELAKI